MTVVHHHHQEPLDPPRIEANELFENDPERDRKLPRRRLARERVMQMLYAHEMSGDDIDALFYDMVQKDLASEQPALEFGRELTLKLTTNRDEINGIITEHLKHWELRRVALIDRLLIQMGITELLYFPEIPPKATINELIEIAKDYSTDESGKFINGLLHAVLTDLKEKGLLKKTGRGLIDKPIPGNNGSANQNGIAPQNGSVDGALNGSASSTTADASNGLVT
jgi:N utilization substance protein B